MVPQYSNHGTGFVPPHRRKLIAKRKAAAAYSNNLEVAERAELEREHSMMWDAGSTRRRSRSPRVRPTKQSHTLASNQFSFGNYDRALSATRQQLCDFGILEFVERPYADFATLNELLQDELDRDDHWAFDIIQDSICPRVTSRLSHERPCTAPKLLAQLKTACQPFRFLDLPLDMQVCVYDLLVPSYIDPLSEYYYYCEGFPSRPEEIRRLCAVSQDFRVEILRLYFARNRFCVTFLFGYWPRPLQMWADTIGITFLQHLTDLKVEIEYYQEFQDTVHITYDNTEGFRVEVMDEDGFMPEGERQAKFCKLMNRRKVEQGWQGTGVIECFTRNADALRELVSDRWRDEEDERPIDEHDAYQVAYGRPLVRVVLDPW
ncbi:hypothetical protein LTR86_010490 [Recurvomyces mirabilis]|nr:hypothetical protein LTR86_010490 [Recurvomyces mirabilis]